MVDHKKHFKADLTDRTVFWEILRSKRRNDHRLTRRLESSLSDHKRRCVRQIAKHQAFYNAFDKLSRIPGLRLGLVIGNLHRLITLKCDEEVVNYLEHIYNTWLYLVGNVESNLKKIDPFTVQSVELRCPRFSAEDERVLRNAVLDGRIFGCFDESERIATWKTLRSIESTIPSLSTFFNDVKYLELCAKWMKRLVAIPHDGLTVQTALTKAFKHSMKEGNLYPIENSNMDFSYRPVEADARFQLGLRQLWLFTMRNFRQLGTNPGLLPKLADLASKLGFDTSNIRSLKSVSPDFEIAQQALSMARPSRDYDYDGHDFQAVADKIAHTFPDLQRIVSAQELHDFFTDDASGTRQSSRPWLNQMSYAEAAESLFIDVMDKDLCTGGERLACLFICRSIHLAFFCAPRRNIPQLQVTSFDTGTLDAESLSSGGCPPQGLDQPQEPKTSHEQILANQQGNHHTKQSPTRIVTLEFITEEVRREEHVYLDTQNPNEALRFQSLLQEAMYKQKVLPISVGRQPLLVMDCYKEVVEKGLDRILLVQTGHIDTRLME
ncbi:uncharacterized protein CCOS01_16570 [Colletotrichum costaricense]|uniref:Uncharacterized protein n=1 Tax=Colletotrichum costaricense TaxID=1209916 RepID=A0AAI9YFG0_9PEZI|nr:uncharacterized protein CCOS01_16570 [Colletotrichum costaricense]KAK1506518.1 hypothetical protein CCOS01_16570 [Colletotrichum costaricense]